jgi:hypothetical protein
MEYSMSFQAYLDAIERKTGRTPDELLSRATELGYGPDTKPGVIVEWLKTEFDLGRGHAMALVHVIRNGPRLDNEHVGSTGSHRDESAELRLDGIALRGQATQ